MPIPGGGDVYFTTGQLRARPDLESTSTYPDSALSSAHDWVVGIIERETGTSFIPRATTDVLSGNDATADGRLALSRGWVLSLASVTVDGVALTAGELADCVVDGGGLLWRRSGWTGHAPWSSGRANVTVVYDAGYTPVCPPSLKEAALDAARWWLLTTWGKSGMPDRATSITNEFGNVQLATPDAARRRYTGLPGFDAELAGWVDKTALYGFA